MFFANTPDLSSEVTFSLNDLLSSKPVTESKGWAQYPLSEVLKGPGK